MSPSGAARLVLAAVLIAFAPLADPLAAAAPCRTAGAIGDYWASVGGDRSFLGPCVTDEQPVRAGVEQRFRDGAVYWSAATGARSVHGAVRVAYDAMGGPSSRLGLPTTHELPTPGRPGAYHHFTGGSIYWSEATGAHLVAGSIRDRWAAQGWENGPLGFPTTSEQATPVKAGAYSHFAGGSVYWSPSTGAHPVVGDIRARWAALGWENSALGFPASAEYPVAGGARSDFTGGSISWEARTRQTTVTTGPRPSFTFSVQSVTAADLPNSYRAGCPVPPQDLRLLRMSHVDFAGAERTGEMVVHADEVTQVLRVFARVHEGRFPIARMERIDAFGGSDDASMRANNSSAFNCRRSTGGSGWSEHAYGRALDLNPVQNPYVSGDTVLPESGRAYLDRGNRRPGMLLAGDPVVQALAAQGWSWGGAWTRPRDYQHFSRSGR